MTPTMNPPRTRTPDALLAGSTGLIGREIARQWSRQSSRQRADSGTLHLLLRREPAAALAPGQQAHIVDFSALPSLPPADRAFCALGTTIKVAGSKAAFRAVDFDAVLAFAGAARRAGVTRFGVVSALGASPRSASFYSRVKGEMEAALAQIGFETLVIARPSLLTGDRTALSQPTRTGEALANAITAPLAWMIPATWRPIAAATVARAMLRALAESGPGVHVIESGALQRLGQDDASRRG
jgi:uncharacterized protein YbjT (DUF2867 family)